MNNRHRRRSSSYSSESEDELCSLIKRARRTLEELEEARTHRQDQDYSQDCEQAQHRDQTPGNSVPPSPPPEESQDGAAVVVPPDAAPPLPQQLLLALGGGEATISSGPPLLEELVKRWTPILRNGLDAENRTSIRNKYPFPVNCPALEAPSLNLHVKTVLGSSSITRDERLLGLQQQLGCALGVIGSLITTLLTPGALEEDATQQTIRMATLLGDTDRLLADLHFPFSESRRALIVNYNGVNKQYVNTLTESPVGEQLFGDDLVQRLSSTKQLEETSRVLKRETTNARPTPKLKGRLNYQRPPLSRSSYSRGGRTTQSTRSRPYSNKSRAYQSKASSSKTESSYDRAPSKK